MHLLLETAQVFCALFLVAVGMGHGVDLCEEWKERRQTKGRARKGHKQDENPSQDGV